MRRCPSCVPANLCRCGWQDRAKGYENLAVRAARERAELEASVAHLRPMGREQLIQESIKDGLTRHPRGSRTAAILGAVVRDEWRTARAVQAQLGAPFMVSDVSRRLLALAQRGQLEHRKVHHPQTSAFWWYEYRAKSTDA